MLCSGQCLSVCCPVSLDSDEEFVGGISKVPDPFERSHVHVTHDGNLFGFPKSRSQEALDRGKHCSDHQGGLPEFSALLANRTMRSGVDTEKGALIKQSGPLSPSESPLPARFYSVQKSCGPTSQCSHEASHSRYT